MCSRNLETWNKMSLLIEAVLVTSTVIFPINLKLVFLLTIHNVIMVYVNISK